MSFLNDPSMAVLEQGLGLSLRRQLVINSNVANIDTPGFTPSDIDFDAELQKAIGAGRGPRRTHHDHLNADGARRSEVSTFERPDGPAGADGNSVDLDVQMARMSQNAVLYQASTRAVSKKIALLKYAVTQGSEA
ncbi:flagellar basal body rod protein FlgB [Persicimonas caeni]|jgi:flagellar basal-body rod protein FlgB|uniref:Flagellar basal body rod protein FlgB n=1 Tax=Persicimonas caeni TaxID=2292766 RepID=A0A4Y6PSL3_PERCE|nr:flagellar basal body rod protein FlgB [Persicimonas caeni]QDG51326.1 flagellar basal body rod protein FlgB [Persicimonas caeni]QED32547.1 flagellar basal body rod protein FlgB [Persicimonas caeni]